MKIILLFGIALCAYAADVKEAKTEKRQTQEGLVPTRLIYRVPRKQEQAAPVEEPQQDEDSEPASNTEPDEYRRGQVYSLNAQELLDLQPERKAPLTSNQLLQQLYQAAPQENKQNLQQIYYLDPQVGRQVSLQPSHAVIARPTHSFNGGEASVGAALSVSDTGASSASSLNHELLALFGQAPIRQEESRKQSFAQPAQPQQAQLTLEGRSVQSVAPQYQQVDRYVAKSTKKPTKLRAKVQIIPPNTSAAPQQYLIETTNVQQQQQLQQIHPQLQAQVQYHQTPQTQRHAQVRYIPFQQSQPLQQPLYERPESQGLKVVEAPKLQQVRQPQAQLNYRYIPQYLPEAAPKQYRLIEVPKPQQIKQEQRVQPSNVERPATYLKRFPETEKLRSVKIYDPVLSESLLTQPAQDGADQFLLRPVYKTNDPRGRYELPALPSKPESRVAEPFKPQSAIYVNKNLAPRKMSRPQFPREHNVDGEEPAHEQQFRSQSSNIQQVNIEQYGHNIDEQRSHLPPPRNNKAYTPEEFAALVAAGYAVTPVPINGLNLDVAQSRSETDSSQTVLTAQPNRRPSNRRPLYLPLRGDDAP